jgi:hypothetical protein
MSGSKGGFSLSVGLVDSASAGLDGINKRLAALSAPADRFNRSMSKFAEVSGINRVTEGVKGLGYGALETARSLERMVSPMGALTSGATIAGALALAKSWGDVGTQIGRSASVLGMPISGLSRIDQAAKLAGVSVDSANSALAAMYQRMAQVANHQGSQEDVNILKLIGIDPGTPGKIHDINDAMGALAEKMKDMKPEEQAYFLDKALGSHDLLPMLNKGRKGWEDYQKAAEKTGSVLTEDMGQKALELSRSFNALGADIEGVKNHIVHDYAPGVTTALEWTSKWIEGNQNLAKSYTEFGIAVGALMALPAMVSLASFLKLTTGAALALRALPLLLTGQGGGTNDQEQIDADKTARAAWDVAHPGATFNPFTGWHERDGSPIAQGPGAAGPSGATAAPRLAGPRVNWTPQAPGPASVDRETGGRAKSIHDMFVGKGATDAEAWGMAGNAVAESAAKWNSGPGDNGAAHGAFMWRDKRLDAYIAKYGHLPEQGSQQEQVDFAWDELHGSESDAWAQIQKAARERGAAGAGGAGSRFYERPGVGEAKQAEEEAHRAGIARALAGDASAASAAVPVTDPRTAGSNIPGMVSEHGGPPVATVSGGVHVTVAVQHNGTGAAATAVATGHATTAPPTIETSLPAGI